MLYTVYKRCQFHGIHDVVRPLRNLYISLECNRVNLFPVKRRLGTVLKKKYLAQKGHLSQLTFHEFLHALETSWISFRNCKNLHVLYPLLKVQQLVSIHSVVSCSGKKVVKFTLANSCHASYSILLCT